MPRPPPFARIADALRSQIEAGQLEPGERVPSVRALAKRWRVATATAAHALRVLGHEGYVRAEARSGTIVAGARHRSTRAGRRDARLGQQHIVAAALELADAEGLPALSIRALASRLGAPPMTLYQHVRSKEELLRLMVAAALDEESLPVPPPTGWRAQLEVGARLEWRVLRRHPWLARVMSVSRPNATPSALAFVDWVMRALDRSALDAAGRLEVHVVLHGFVQGLAVNLEAEAQAVGETGTTEEDHMRAEEAGFAAQAASGRFPYFAKILRGIPGPFALDLDRVFELGLAALLDGFAPAIEGRRPLGRR